MDLRQDILDNRKSFLVYFDWAKYVDKLTKEQNGSLFEAMVKLAMTGEDTDFSDDLVLSMVWIGVSDAIKRDTEKYISKCQRNRENGANGGRPRKDEKNPEKPNGYFGLSTETQRNPEKPDIDIDTDMDRETDIDRDSDIDIDTRDTDTIGRGYLREYVYGDFISTWNKYVKYGVEEISEFTTWQKSTIDNLIIKHDWTKVYKAVERIANSDYLLGKVNGSRPITLNWFLKEENMLKVFEGKYDSKSSPNPWQ